LGETLLSRKRLLSVLLTTAIAICIPCAYALIYADKLKDERPFYFFGEIHVFTGPTYLAVAAGLFALSLSFSRFVSRVLIRVLGTNPHLNLIVLVLLTLTHFLVLALWYTIGLGFITVIGSCGQIREGDMGFVIDLFRPQFFWNELTLQDITLPGEMGWKTLPEDVFNWASHALLYAGNLLRVGVLALFLTSYAFEWVLRRPMSLVWRRLVESDKPIFTILFGASASLATLAKELAKALA
jgi:hypothetical protein